MTCDPIEPNIGMWIRCGVNRTRRVWLFLYVIWIVLQFPYGLGLLGSWGRVASNIWIFFFLSVFTTGYQFYILRIVRGDESVRPSVILGVFRRYFTLLGAFFLYILGGTIGLILLVVPGIIFLFRYYYAMLAIVDEGLGIRDAFAWSAEITKGYVMKLFLLNLGWAALTWALLAIWVFIFTGFKWPVSMYTAEVRWLNLIPAILIALIIPWSISSFVAAYASLSARAQQGGSRLERNISPLSLDTTAE